MARLDGKLRTMEPVCGKMADRLVNELKYARRVSLVNGGKYDELVEAAFDAMVAAVKRDGALTDEAALAIEESLKPMQADCKKYRLIMVGHAHIDMNWMWRYDETVSITLDTFRTALNLMKEFPEFTFAQSQASVYKIVEQHEPKMIEEIRERIQKGQWEVSASTWVEADRNMPSAESVARHHLYTKRYLSDLLGIEADSLDLDYEPDTFGHHQNVPEMLTQAGVKFYYHCRGEEKEILYRWQSPSGAEILVYREPYWYLGPIERDMAEFVPQFCETYKMNTAMRVYGVGDHGGGPTRRDLERIVEMGSWPIYPDVHFGTYKEFYAAADAARECFPVLTGERNFIFTGCYTTQTRIKLGNAMGEKLMLEAEGLNAFATLTAGAPYSREAFANGWKNILFNQFHDIIPGSGVVDTREYAMGTYQESYAVANSAKRAACAAIAQNIDTSKFVPSCNCASRGEGAGVGFGVYPFKLAQVERGGGNTSRIFHLFNPLSVKRKEVVELTVWDFNKDFGLYEFVDAAGKTVKHQVLDQGFNHYWQHDYARVLIEAEIPALGYATYGLKIKEELEPRAVYMGDLRLHKPMNPTLENELVKATFDETTGMLASFIDKETGEELLSKEGAGFRLIREDASMGMTSWTVGRYMKNEPLAGAVMAKHAVHGDLYDAFTFTSDFARSKIEYTVSLAAGSRALTYDVKCDWLETGDMATGIPQLQFAAACKDARAQYLFESPGGLVRREARTLDLPSLGMIAAEGEKGKTVLLSDCKYGFRGDGNVLSATLIRSSFDPDPYPELGQHTFRISFGASHAQCDKCLLEEKRLWNHPVVVVSGSNHEGSAPLNHSFMESCGSAIVSAVKLCEDEDALLVRGYEINGKDGEIALTFAQTPKCAQLVDALEQPLTCGCAASIDGNAVKLAARPYGMFALKVKF